VHSNCFQVENEAELMRWVIAGQEVCERLVLGEIEANRVSKASGEEQKPVTDEAIAESQRRIREVALLEGNTTCADCGATGMSE
jgi:hypothetical protein